MKMSAPLTNAIVNNALLHSNSRIKQMPPQIIHILHFLWYTRCPRFCNEMYWGQSCSVARSLEVLWVSYIIALSDWRSKWCTECYRRHSSWKR